MEQQGKYYNPKYPDTSNDWTRNWEKSWLLRKDKYLLGYASEKERKTVIKVEKYTLFFFAFAMLGILSFFSKENIMYIGDIFASNPLPYWLDICLFLFILIRFTWIYYFIMSMLCFIMFPIYSLIFFDYTINNSYVPFLFYIFLLIQGFNYIVYYFNRVYLRQFDDVIFDDVAKLYINSNLEKDLKEAFITKISKNKIMIYLFDMRPLSSLLYFFRLSVSSVNNILIQTFSRFSAEYNWLYFLKKDMVDKLLSDKNVRKPVFSKLICFVMLFSSLLSTIVLFVLFVFTVKGYILRVFSF
ncbi:hypothetical protein [Francisella philomiragia]|uniref:Putative membrane protein n=1 Tax=Francisella philomiragia TaxID=28110 RepID=A0A0B6D622_9GAMM|nr:hypothetical protein [Francisella philomiragia]AJI53747.1 putative membrane protein [Francisella philomiragia]